MRDVGGVISLPIQQVHPSIPGHVCVLNLMIPCQLFLRTLQEKEKKHPPRRLSGEWTIGGTESGRYTFDLTARNLDAAIWRRSFDFFADVFVNG